MESEARPTPATAAPPYPVSRLLRDLGGRSFLPLLAIGLIAAVPLWGPWVSLALTVSIWRLSGWVA